MCYPTLSMKMIFVKRVATIILVIIENLKQILAIVKITSETKTTKEPFRALSHWVINQTQPLSPTPPKKKVDHGPVGTSMGK